MEHPDIARALATGYPGGQAQENGDCPEARRTFAWEEFPLFLDFALDGAPGLLEDFVAHYGWKYQSWLN